MNRAHHRSQPLPLPSLAAALRVGRAPSPGAMRGRGKSRERGEEEEAGAAAAAAAALCSWHGLEVRDAAVVVFAQKERPFKGQGGRCALFVAASGVRVAAPLLDGVRWAPSLVAMEGEDGEQVKGDEKAAALSLSKEELDSL